MGEKHARCGAMTTWSCCINKNYHSTKDALSAKGLKENATAATLVSGKNEIRINKIKEKTEKKQKKLK